MLHTTFRKAKEAGACIESYRKMAETLGGVKKYGLDTPIPLDKVLEVCGFDDALWALRIVIEPADKEIRLFACDCAERVLPLFESNYSDDKRPRQVIAVARRFAEGQATREELAETRSAADAAWYEAYAADAAWSEADVADAAWYATWYATRYAADAADAARSAAYAARSAAYTARTAEREWQEKRLLELLRG